jgi:deferrochelatase/peroxidase EfeB
VRDVSRRRFLGATGLLGAAAAGVLATDALAPDVLGGSPPAAGASGAGSAGAAVAFHGEHQAGILTPAQDRLLFASFDVVADDRDELVAMLRDWTEASARLAVGAPVGTDDPDQDAPPDDTGEAVGLPPSALTLTFGFGPTLFTRDGVDRFGIATKRPDALIDLPAFAGEELDPARGGGDLAVQACANDPTVCFHAIRNLARIGRGVVALRWSQPGFGRTSSTDTAQDTPRNLMGFKDGTNNVVAEDSTAIREHVWVAEADDPAWMRGGSYLVARRIRMLLEVWDRSTLADQELSIGRVKASGAPLGQDTEHAGIDLAARRAGKPVIPVDAHIRLAAPSENGGARLLRRGYSFTDGIDPVTNQLDAGLFFLAYQRDPRTGFVRVQQNLAADALNEYIRHVGSAVFAVPPGVQTGGSVGETLFT